MPQARPVQVLSEQVANQIAAGEVVERPASVVKELLENAIDAGSTRIEVEITDGGRKRVAVHDNGSGMAREDALRALQRQATSKIRTAEDITRIATLGFRGEAIPSIASVSRFTLRTRTEGNDAGTELHVVGGTLEDVIDAGIPIGTTVEVCDLFFNTPARKKFLRATATELTRIRTTFLTTALAHPELGFILRADGRELHRLPEGDSLADRIRSLLGGDVADALLPVKLEEGPVRVSGYIALPSLMRTGSSEQYVFVNGRPATAPIIQYALREAYPAKDAERRPVTVLFIELPPEEVDVNVHPAKREVRFRKPSEITQAVMRAVLRAFTVADEESGGITRLEPEAPPQAPQKTVDPIAPPPAHTPFYPLPDTALDTRAAAYPHPVNPPLPAFTSPRPIAAELPFTLPEGTSTDALWKWVRVADVLEDAFVLLVTDGGYVTLDARAAWERVVYERLILRTKGEPVSSQQLLLPETIQLPPDDADRVRRYRKELEEMGFGVSEFGTGDTFIIDALPDVLSEISCRELLITLAHDLDQTGVKKGSDHWREEVVARAAGQAAAGLHRRLTPETAAQLVQLLAAARMPYTSPRGRPTMILTTYRELARRFGRN